MPSHPIPRVELTPEREEELCEELAAALWFCLDNPASEEELRKLAPDYKPNEPRTAPDESAPRSRATKRPRRGGSPR